jgi:hypothetical protein
MQDAEALALHRRITDAQEALRQRLRTVPPSRLAQRPSSGEWSALENVRHLIFAEQHHFKPHLPRGFRWSSAGVPPPNRTGETRLSPVGKDRGATVDELFDAWAKVHEAVRSCATEDAGRLAWRLEGNLNHIMLHARAIDRLLGTEPR